jgi:low temperature requirement protein LtrA
MSDLFRPPRYHQDVHFHKHTDRAVGWLELFYDLVYVATLIQIGNFLSSNLTLTGFGQFCVLLFVVWWAWTGETLYQNRYFVDDAWHRLLVLIQMIGVAAMGLSVSGAFGELGAQFAVAYALVRAMLVVMFVRVKRSHPERATVSSPHRW